MINIQIETRDPKIKTIEELRPIIEARRANGDRIAQASGCFILAHIGHLKYLKYAKSLADVLIVSINTDRSLKAVRADKNRFYVDEDNRAEMLAGLEVVDYVTLFDETTADDLVLTLKPDFFVKGADYEGQVLEKDSVESYGGQVVVSPTAKLWSSTHFLKLLTDDVWESNLEREKEYADSSARV